LNCYPPSERVSIYRRWRFHGKTVAALAYEYGVRLFVIDEVIRQQTAAVENDVRLEDHRAGRLSVSPPNWPSPAKAA